MLVISICAGRGAHEPASPVAASSDASPPSDAVPDELPPLLVLAPPLLALAPPDEAPPFVGNRLPSRGSSLLHASTTAADAAAAIAPTSNGRPTFISVQLAVAAGRRRRV